MVAVQKSTQILPFRPERVYGGHGFDEPAAVMAIGNTPLLSLRRFARRTGLPDSIELWLKAEWANPGGSVKDRPALGIVRDGLAKRGLGDGKVLLDATSGNNRNRLCHARAAFGFPVELVIPENASDERKLMPKPMVPS